MSSETDVSTSSDEMLRTAVVDILSTLDPSQATYRQIRESLLRDHNINADGKKEIILTFVEQFFSGLEGDTSTGHEDEEIEAEMSVKASTKSKQLSRCNGTKSSNHLFLDV